MSKSIVQHPRQLLLGDRLAMKIVDLPVVRVAGQQTGIGKGQFGPGGVSGFALSRAIGNLASRPVDRMISPKPVSGEPCTLVETILRAPATFAAWMTLRCWIARASGGGMHETMSTASTPFRELASCSGLS